MNNPQCAPGFFNQNPKSMDFFALMLHLYIKQLKISWKKNIFHLASKTEILKKRIFYTKTCSLMAFFSLVYRIDIWKPNDKFFFNNSDLSYIKLQYKRRPGVTGGTTRTSPGDFWGFHYISGRKKKKVPVVSKPRPK